MRSVNTMLDYNQSGSIFDRPGYQEAVALSIGMQDYITQKAPEVTACKAFAYEQKKQWDELLYHRETEAGYRSWKLLG